MQLVKEDFKKRQLIPHMVAVKKQSKRLKDELREKILDRVLNRRKVSIKDSKHEKYSNCGEIFSIFASHANINISKASLKEQLWFNDFAWRFFMTLNKHDKLCPVCLELCKRLGKELAEKITNKDKYEELDKELIVRDLKKKK